ncbi:hypothetical protein LINPERPRIM_LOCUS17011 [Linum perenne]
MSLFLLPKKMIKRMNSLLRRFFWSDSMTKKSIHWCKGEKLCDSHQIGVWDLGNLERLTKPFWLVRVGDFSLPRTLFG